MRADRGFTLLETVAAVTILAAIAGIIAIALRLASASIARGDEETRAMARLRAGIGIVERAVRSADAAPIRVAGEEKPFFRGERHRLRFLTAASSVLSPGGGFRLLCFVESTGSEPRGLAVSEASPFRPGGAGGWEGTEGLRVFLPGARDLAFAYSPGPTARGTWEWLDSWDAAEEGKLPAAVRIEYVTAEEGGEGVPAKTAFVVPVPAGG